MTLPASPLGGRAFGRSFIKATLMGIWVGISLLIIAPRPALGAPQLSDCTNPMDKDVVLKGIEVVRGLILREAQGRARERTEWLQGHLHCSSEPLPAVQLADIAYLYAVTHWDPRDPAAGEPLLRQVFALFPAFEWDFDLVLPESSQANEVLYGAFKLARGEVLGHTGWLDLSRFPKNAIIYVDGTDVTQGRGEALQLTVGYHFVQAVLPSGLAGRWYQVTEGEIMTPPPLGGRGASNLRFSAAMSSLWLQSPELAASSLDVGAELGITWLTEHLELGVETSLYPLQRPELGAEDIDARLPGPVWDAAVKFGWHSRGGDLTRGVSAGLFCGVLYVPDANGYEEISDGRSWALAVPTAGVGLGGWASVAVSLSKQSSLLIGIDGGVARLAALDAKGEALLASPSIVSPTLGIRLGLAHTRVLGAETKRVKR